MKKHAMNPPNSRRRTFAPSSRSDVLDVSTMSNIESSTSSRDRSLMAPIDFQSSPSRLRAVKQERIQKTNTQESEEIKLQFLYNDYLQALMTDVLAKKKFESGKEICIKRLVEVARQLDRDDEKLLKIKKREFDINNLSNIQKRLDELIVEANVCKLQEDNKVVRDFLIKLNDALKVDTLRCDNIVLPENEKEWEEMKETFKKCSVTLKNIKELLVGKAENYKVVADKLKEFDKIHRDIEDIEKKIESELSFLQIHALKNSIIPNETSDN